MNHKVTNQLTNGELIESNRTVKSESEMEIVTDAADSFPAGGVGIGSVTSPLIEPFAVVGVVAGVGAEHEALQSSQPQADFPWALKLQGIVSIVRKSVFVFVPSSFDTSPTVCALDNG